MHAWGRREHTAHHSEWVAMDRCLISAPARREICCNARDLELEGIYPGRWSLQCTTRPIYIFARPAVALVEDKIWTTESRLAGDGARQRSAACHGMLPCRKGKLSAWTSRLASDDTSRHA